jgi:hypothetical protein
MAIVLHIDGLSGSRQCLRGLELNSAGLRKRNKRCEQRAEYADTSHGSSSEGSPGMAPPDKLLTQRGLTRPRADRLVPRAAF